MKGGAGQSLSPGAPVARAYAMPKGGHVNWFRELFGFEESGSYSKNQAHFSLDGDTLVCETAPSPAAKRMHVGPWSTPSVAELRERCGGAAGAAADDLGGLTFTHLADPVGVVPLIANPDNAGAVFQAASQFNALEMTGPGVTPRQGISIYATDPTQGPKCALACPGMPQGARTPGRSRQGPRPVCD